MLKMLELEGISREFTEKSLGYIRGYTTIFVKFIISHYWHAYYPTTIMECNKFFFSVAHVLFLSRVRVANFWGESCALDWAICFAIWV